MRPVDKEIVDLRLQLAAVQRSLDSVHAVSLAKDAEIDRLRASHTELREIWLRDGWRLIERAPKNDVVDLWGSERDGGGCLRWPDCWWGPSELSEEVLGEGWFCRMGRGTLPFRIWPTHWRPVPGRPT